MRVALLIAVAALTGCAGVAPQKAPIERVAFDPSELDWFKPVGGASVTGQAFLRTRGGDVRTAAGSTVQLFPVSKWASQWYADGCLLGARFRGGTDQRVAPYMKFATADAAGRFSISGVGSGQYYLVTSVTWQVPSRYGLVPQGGYLARLVKLDNKTPLEVVLTSQDRCHDMAPPLI